METGGLTETPDGCTLKAIDMKKHLVCFAAVCGCIAVIVCLALENVRIKQRISTEEKPQLQALRGSWR